MRHFFTTAFLLISAIAAFGQHTVKGKVTDQDGKALVGATVTIQNSKQTTNSEGIFVFDHLTKTRYTLVCSSVGYETATQQISTDKELVIMLKSKSYSINEITVTSLRATDKSPVAYTNIDKNELAKNNLGQDIPYMLAMTPSLVASSDAGTGVGYTGFRIRGTDASRINVTINGIPYNDADEQGAYWVDLPDLTSSIENIQVQRGVGTSTNGAGAFGANINIQTNNYAPKASGEVSASYGSFNTRKTTIKASTGLLNNHWAIDARLSGIQSDGYIDRASVDMKSYLVQAGYYSEKTSVKFITFGGTEKTYHAWNGIPKDSLATHRTYNSCGYMGNDAKGNPMYYTDQTDNYTQTHYQLIGVHAFNSEFSINGGLHYTRGDGYYEEYKTEQKLKKYGIPTYNSGATTVAYSDLVRQKKMGNDFAGGVFSLNYTKSNLVAQLGGAANCYWGDHWGDVTLVKDYPSNIFPKEYYRNSVKKWDANVYLKANFDLDNQLYLNTELQYRRVDYSLNGKNDKWDSKINQMKNLAIKKTFDFFNPKVGLLYKIDAQNECYGSFAIANREPTRTNYTDAIATNLPTNETLYDTEFGYKFHNNTVSAGANLFYMSYHNQLVLTGKINEIGEPLSENVHASYRTGAEFVGSIKFSGNIRWDGSLTLSKNRIKDFTEYVDVYDENWDLTSQQKNAIGDTPIAFSPSTIWNNAFTVTYGRFETRWMQQYVGKQYIDNTGSDDKSLDAYSTTNLRLSYSLPLKHTRGVDFSVLINNLTDAKYISNAWTYSYYQGDATGKAHYNDYGFFPQAGINFLAGITVKF